MLYLVQDPRNKYPIMEENPLHSKDVLYGVPTVFKEILNSVVETLAKNNEELFKMQVLQMKEESFKVEPIHEIPIIEDNVSEEPFRINDDSEEFSPIKVSLPEREQDVRRSDMTPFKNVSPLLLKKHASGNSNNREVGHRGFGLRSDLFL